IGPRGTVATAVRGRLTRRRAASITKVRIDPLAGRERVAQGEVAAIGLLRTVPENGRRGAYLAHVAGAVRVRVEPGNDCISSDSPANEDRRSGATGVCGCRRGEGAGVRA